MFRIRKPKVLAGVVIGILTVVSMSFFHTFPAYACQSYQVFEGGTCTNKCTTTQIYTTIDIGTATPHCVDNPTNNTDLTKNPIYTWLIVIIQFASAGVGIAVVGGIVWGALLYLTSRDNASQTQKAVSIIINALIALLLFFLMFAILNFLIPGGILT